MSICFCKSIQYIALQEHLVPDNKAKYRAAAVTAIKFELLFCSIDIVAKIIIVIIIILQC